MIFVFRFIAQKHIEIGVFIDLKINGAKQQRIKLKANEGNEVETKIRNDKNEKEAQVELFIYSSEKGKKKINKKHQQFMTCDCNILNSPDNKRMQRQKRLNSTSNQKREKKERKIIQQSNKRGKENETFAVCL